jgi:predicted alpha/beta-hydrolase family hydrolase
MQSFAERLGRFGTIECFDYPYQQENRRAPDRHPVLLAAHRAAFERLRARHSGPIVCVGKSMGGRIGCHLAVDLGAAGPVALVCLGYPLVGQNGGIRDQVLLDLRTPVLFIQGTRDPLCPLEHLARVRDRMTGITELAIVAGGDHSLRVAQPKASPTRSAALDAEGTASEQETIDEWIVSQITAFIDKFSR